MIVQGGGAYRQLVYPDQAYLVEPVQVRNKKQKLYTYLPMLYTGMEIDILCYMNFYSLVLYSQVCNINLYAYPDPVFKVNAVGFRIQVVKQKRIPDQGLSKIILNMQCSKCSFWPKSKLLGLFYTCEKRKLVSFRNFAKFFF